MAGAEDQIANGLLREQKGAGWTVLWALILVQRGMTAVALEQATGYSDKTVRHALRKLEKMGLTRHNGRARGWRLSRHGWQVIVTLLLGGLKE